jgi:hypothetical protein
MKHRMVEARHPYGSGQEEQSGNPLTKDQHHPGTRPYSPRADMEDLSRSNPPG